MEVSVLHIAHAVASGPYSAIGGTNAVSALVNVDASESHTLSKSWIGSIFVDVEGGLASYSDW
jgi:hypothetical protein